MYDLVTEYPHLVFAELDDSLPVFCDIETEKLYSGVRLIQVYQPSTMDIPTLFDISKVNLDLVKSMLKVFHTVWYGAYYDFGTLNMTTMEYDDIQLLVRTAYPEFGEYKLDYVTKQLVGDELYEGLDKKLLQKQGFKMDAELTQDQLRYAAADVMALSIMWKDPKIQAVRNKLFYKLDMHCLDYTIQFQQNGAIVDTKGVQEELDKLPTKLQAEQDVLDTMLHLVPEVDKVNSKSPKMPVIFASLLDKPVQSTDKSFLVNIMTKYQGTPTGDFAKAVYDNRRTRLRETNLKKLLHDKVYTKFNPYGTVTGRYSSRGKDIPQGINFQNVTRDLQYLLEQDTEDTVVIHLDYSTAELRAACIIMGDSTMRQYLLEGRDLHKVSAMLADTTIAKLEDVTKAQRQKGKAVSFGFIFGMSADRFKQYAYDEYGVLFTEEEAKQVKREYQLLYRDIAKYHQYWWKQYKKEFVRSPMGRANKPRLGTDAINYATQACIGETCKLAIHYLVKDYGREVLDYLYMQVHDALVLRVPKGKEHYWTEASATAMLKAWEEVRKLKMMRFNDIPMGVEYSYSGGEHEIFDIKDFHEL